MKIFNRPALSKFKEEYADSAVPLDAWELEAEEAQWSSPKEVKKLYRSATLAPNRIVFSLARGLYRLAVKVRYERGVLLVERVWAEAHTHGTVVH
ncbi:MAG TPA: type II toxin-antitoxin system HigB family toxin [Ramlibacter sp.]|jgi:mRNA interferase HigB|nr:type II toxin-antitoxin system HigB family toxin [Ramlibacter sp.]